MMGKPERIPTFGFVRGAVVRQGETGPNMLVVRGLGKTTAVIVIEGDEGAQVRLREVLTSSLTQILASVTGPVDHVPYGENATENTP